MRGAASSQRAGTRRRLLRGLVLLLAMAALTACTDNVTGTPHGAAGFGPSPSAPSQPVPPPRRLDGPGTCALLVPADLGRVGGAEPV
ncbi:MAG TPA: hypothetical protein VHH34_06260, partial [Pseudonocardiaceae bacterium]|nr:hypothetical protein [Pseudonocardiaceae bacterium]